MGEATYRAATTLGRALVRALDVDLRFEGLDNLPASGPAVIASTHVSYLDMWPLGLAARERGRFPRFLARHDVWQPVVGRAMTAMGHVPVDRAAPAAALLQARRLLEAGETVVVFPEAGISYSHTVRDLMRGTAALARDTGAPVVPAALWGVQRIYSVGRPEGGVLGGKEPGPDLTRGRCIDVVLGSPMPAVSPEAQREDLTAWTVGLGHRLTGMLEGLQLLERHRPAPGEHAPWYPAHLGGHAPDRDEARAWDNVPRHAISPVWGPRSEQPQEQVEPWQPERRHGSPLPPAHA
ncbi:lysophospholipid acyltransferase family protein [Nocardioides yefusunii]|uniref:Lysophospholipid acyltransferase family protein n=1 Tax=Nocardioides yefusunii TaxID=2500546 RepID=A0ABW1QX90_9ACTN|nr:lysophospholipid acyltransferase family protein [Nocardioides yefusunii]